MSGRRRECLCPRASLLQHHPRPGQVQAARRRQGKAAVRRARRRLTAQARITARSSPCSAELPGSGSNGTAGPFCAAAAASRGLNKLVRSQNVSSLDGRRDSSRLYYFLATLGSLRAVSTTIPCPAPISSKARVDRRRRRPPSPGGCFRLRTAAAPLRSGPSALRSSAPCSGGEKARNSRRGLQLPAGSSALRPAPHHGRAGAARTAPRTELHPTSPSRPAFALHIHEAAAPDWRNRAPAASRWPAWPPLTQPRLPSPGRDSPGRGTGPAAQPAPSPRSRQRRSPGAALIVPPAPGTMDELDQSPLVSSSSSGPPRPQQPQFNYQFVLDDEKEEDEEEEEEEEEDEDFDEQLEVMERKPVAAPQERPSPPQDLGSPAEPPRPAAPEPAPEPPQPARSPPQPAASSSSSAASTPSPGPERPQPEPRRRGSSSGSAVVDLLYWRDIKKTGVVFGASLFLLLSLTVFSIVSVTAYIALALLSVTISFRIYKGVIQAIQKSDEGHPFRAYLESDVAVSEELIQKYSNVVLGHINGTVKELRRLFLVDDLVDSLKFAVLMWVFTYVGALFNGLTLLILALISLFSVPVIYERHQAQIDHYLGLVNKNVKDAMAKIQAKIPGLKRKTE